MNNSDMKNSSYTILPPSAGAGSTTTTTTTELMPIGHSSAQRTASAYGAGGSNHFHDGVVAASSPPLTPTSVSTFTPIATTGGSGYTDYFSPNAAAAAHASSSFPAHASSPASFSNNVVQSSTYASLISEADNHLYGARHLPPAHHQAHMPYATGGGGGGGAGAPSLQRFIGGLTNKLPELQCNPVGGAGGMDASSYSHMVGLASSASPHASLISPAYSPSSVTTQGSGGGGGGGGANSKRGAIDTDGGKPGAFKSRSKKESHNRIERRRRDYINSQITRLSGLLPADMYRDVDGRRNKGTVLRLSVNYILELRQAVANSGHLRHETTISRRLIPMLVNYVKSLETAVKDLEMQTGKNLMPPSLMEDGSPCPGGVPAYEALLESWHAAIAQSMNSNNNNSCGSGPLTNGSSGSSDSTTQGGDVGQKMEAVPLQLAFMSGGGSAGGPTPPQHQQQHAGSPYLPNAIFMGAPICKLEEGEEMCYPSSGGGGGGDSGGHMMSASTTDSYFDPASIGNSGSTNNSTSGGSSSSMPKFDLAMMQQQQPSSSTDDPMQVECQNH